MQSSEKRNAVNFLSAYILSAFGYEFIFFVMTIYVYEVSQSALKVGIFGALTYLPRLFAAFYGVIVDQHSRSKGFAGVAVIIGLFMIGMSLISDIIMIYFVWLLISIFLILIANVRTALMTEIMTKDQYLQGNSFALISLNAAKVLAPVLAGAAMVTMGGKTLFYLTGFIYFLAALFCSNIRTAHSGPEKTAGKTMDDIKESLQYMKGNFDLKFLTVVGVLWRLFVGLQVALYVVYIKAYLAGTDADYGIFMTVIGVGSILGSMIGPWLVKRASYSAVIFWGMPLHYVSFIFLGLLHNFYTALFVAFLSYTVFYATLVGLHSLRDKATPVAMRGRVYGSVTAVLAPPAIFSMLAGGYLANLFGVEKVFIGAGMSALVSFYLLYLVKGRLASDPSHFSG